MSRENDFEGTRGLQESDRRARAFIELRRPSTAKVAMDRQGQQKLGGTVSWYK